MLQKYEDLKDPNVRFYKTGKGVMTEREKTMMHNKFVLVADTPEETAASRTAFAAAAKEAPQLAAYLDHHMPFYEKLRALAL